ncbi:galactokinase [Roseiarcus fermentans]|uniref:Galactokinase n=1 Tax=Roseiarcus fermentans TaxID=1473586 RepID=A0A366EVT4_9HYPH|nr:galactokinase [Roseiarcus fermentans]RBP06488.1 galactokinase [Roseiarcus fermentans]
MAGLGAQARDVAQDFLLRFGRSARVSRAPGRVNLIGEHTDYNDGFVMPAALDFSTLVAAAPRQDRTIRVYSLFMDETRAFDLDAPAPSGRHDWSDYVFGVAAMLETSGLRLAGADLVVGSDVPLGAGLSSSAALEVAVAHALLAASGLPFEPVAAARVAQRAENDFVGMRCGIMDQYIAACGVAGNALLIDCRSLDARPVPIAPTLRLVIANSHVRHQHAGGDYNDRRAACEEGVRLLRPLLGPIAALRDVTPADLERHRRALPDLVFRRCRHIVTENARVLEAERALKAGDFEACGAAMNASQRSMRDDFAITCPEIDFLADFAQGLAGVHGSRMTGGGFGGCTVSLVEADAVESVGRALVDAYRLAFGLHAEVFVCAPSDGAGFVDLHE